MSFLAPAWLLLGLAVAVPLLLHLLKRRIRERVDFPAARYLSRAEHENLRLRRLRSLALLVARMVAVLALALAAAQPLGRLAGSGHAPTAVAVVLDNSLSSSAVVAGRPVLETLRDAVRTVLDAATSEDRLWLITVDGSVLGGNAAALRRSLDGVDAYGGRGDLADAVSRGLSLVAASGLSNRSVVIATDGQATQWPPAVRVPGASAAVYLAQGSPPPNRTVAMVEPRPLRWTPEGALLLRLAGSDSATYRVSLGAALARGLARPGEEVLVRLAPTERGWLGGTVELTPDELRGDDRRYFAVWIGEPVAVRADGGAGPFAAAALDALVRSGRARNGSAVEIVPADVATRTPALLLAPADPVRVGAANRNLQRLGIPWRLGAVQRQPASASGLGFAVEVRSRFSLDQLPSASDDTLASVAGQPWIVAGDGYVLIASPLVLEASNLPIAAQFVPWLGEQLTALSSTGRGRVLYAAPGGAVSYPDDVRDLERDGGEVLPVPSGGRAPSRPGVYFLRAGASRAGALVVNPEPEESLLERLDAGELQRRLQSDYTYVSSDVGAFARAAFAPGRGRPLRGLFLFLLLCALLVEMLMLRQGRALEAERAA